MSPVGPGAPKDRPGEIRLVRDTVKILGMRLVILFLGLFTGVLTARLLGPEGRGTLAIVMLVVTILSMIGTLGLGTANAYYLGLRKHVASSIFFHSLVLALISSLAMLLLLIPLYFAFRGSFLQGVTPLYLLIAGLGLPFGLLISHVSGIFLGIKDVTTLTLTTVLWSVLSALAIFVGLVMFKGGLVGVLIASTLANMAGALLVAIALSRRITLKAIHWDGRLVRDMVTYGTKAQSANIIVFLNYRLDNFLINFWLGTQQVGHYVIAANLAETLWLVPNAVASLLLPEIASLPKAEGDQKAVDVCRHSTFITFWSCLALGVASSFVIRLLYGEAYLPAALPLLLLLPGVFVTGAAHSTGPYFAARGMIILAPILTGIGLLSDVAMNVIMIPRWGIAGAAVASSISYAFPAAIAVFLFLRFSGRGFGETFILKPSDLRLYLDTFRKGVQGVRYATRNAKVYLGR